jgi:hypothetical protein
LPKVTTTKLSSNTARERPKGNCTYWAIGILAANAFPFATCSAPSCSPKATKETTRSPRQKSCAIVLHHRQRALGYTMGSGNFVNINIY